MDEFKAVPTPTEQEFNAGISVTSSPERKREDDNLQSDAALPPTKTTKKWMEKFKAHVRNLGKLDCSCTKETTRDSYDKQIQGLASPPFTVVKVRDEPMSGPSNFDKPPLEHDLVINEDTACSPFR